LAAARRAADRGPPSHKRTARPGAMLSEKKQSDAPEPYLIQAIRHEPKNATNYWYLGKAYAAKKKNRQAIDNYELYLKYAPPKDADRDKAKEIINQLKRK